MDLDHGINDSEINYCIPNATICRLYAFEYERYILKFEKQITLEYTKKFCFRAVKREQIEMVVCTDSQTSNKINCEKWEFNKITKFLNDHQQFIKNDIIPIIGNFICLSQTCYNMTVYSINRYMDAFVTII
ncbi:hypothetical protein A3Q56_08070 [Intoshia linei]|uniref:Uncharacterized protein n=1 Tax=Intoshia linei TaxID=1819745 RepID=A0A177ARP7_9BILA|nr:hypothetical protein A3Q56_08070 [Intoshia linei]